MDRPVDRHRDLRSPRGSPHALRLALRRVLRLTLGLAGLVAAILPAGCDRAGSQPPAASAPAAAAPARAEPSRWRREGGDELIALAPGELDSGFEAAVSRARASAETAREQWADGSERQRSRWAIKWAAPTRDGGVEYVWVEPLRWSPFRVEGRLASPPASELACGRGRGELVSFPAEELADWVHFLTDDRTGPREGGFTIAWLEGRFG